MKAIMRPVRKCKIDHEKGFYTKTKITSNPHFLEKSGLAKKKINNEFLVLVNELNYNIAKKLKRTKNPIKIFKIMISSKNKRTMLTNFNLNCRYKVCSEFIDIFKIFQKRNIKLNCFCSIKKDSFCLKINNQRKVKVNKDINGILIDETFYQGPSISVKFVCSYTNILSENLLEYCNSK